MHTGTHAHAHKPKYLHLPSISSIFSPTLTLNITVDITAIKIYQHDTAEGYRIPKMTTTKDPMMTLKIVLDATKLANLGRTCPK